MADVVARRFVTPRLDHVVDLLSDPLPQVIQTAFGDLRKSSFFVK
jgi:hypothetical protein